MAAIIRGTFALICAAAFHAILALAALRCGLLSQDAVTLPELDLTSVELSFCDSPDETAAPALSAPPVPPAPESRIEPPQPEPQPTDLPPIPSAIPIPKPPPPAPDRLRPNLPEAPEPKNNPPPQQQQQQSASSAPSQARIDVAKPPSPRNRIKPEYPKGARQRGEEGDVKLKLHIAENGTVDDVEIVTSCGFQELDHAAATAARKARFTPAKDKNGRPMPGTANITLQFRLR